jgi:hypothetical protein
MTKNYSNLVTTNQNELVEGFKTKLGNKHTVTCEVTSYLFLLSTLGLAQSEALRVGEDAKPTLRRKTQFVESKSYLKGVDLNVNSLCN